MPFPRDPFRMVGFGAGVEDYFRPIGDVGDDHVPGAKKGWTEHEDNLLEELRSDQSQAEVHIGGNAVNTLAYMACRSQVPANVAFVSALGTDHTSNAIRTDLVGLGIECLATQDRDYHPSVSIIERLGAGSDRMVRGRPRTPLDEYISDRQIRSSVTRADVVVAASLKSAPLADRIFSLTPPDSFISYNPGSSEFNNPDALLDVMRARRPDLLALNDEELAQLLRAQPDADMHALATEATRYARNVLCTLGKDGVLLASDGQVVHQPAQVVPNHKVVDTLGAGDRAHAIALEGLLAGNAHEVILQRVARGTAGLIQHLGAHGDLYN